MVLDQSVVWAAGAAVALGITAASSWWLREAVRPPKLYHGEGELSSEVLPCCPLLLQPYHPTPWAVNRHVQTIVGLLRRASIDGNYRRQLLQAGDGATLGLDWFDHCDERAWGPDSTPILLVLHGINGGSHEGYCKWACASACSKGWRAVVLNYRGCNGLPLTSPRGYSATLSDDIQLAVESIKGRFPSAPLFAAGYSLGSVILAKYLAESDSGHEEGRKSGSGLVAACLVSNPVCLEGSAAQLAHPWRMSFMYNLALAYKLKEYIRHHRSAIEEQTRVDVEEVLSSWTVQAVEEQALLKAFGYQNRKDYYRDASSLIHLPLIKTPTLLLLSADDPFLGALPIKECSSNPATLLAVTEQGGHVAFLKGIWPFQQSWMDEVVVQYCEQVLLHQQRKQWRQQQERAQELQLQPQCGELQDAQLGQLLSKQSGSGHESTWKGEQAAAMLMSRL